MDERTLVVSLLLLTLLGQRPARSQSQQDTLSLYSAVLAFRLGEVPIGPSGPVEVVCDIASSEGFRIVWGDERDSLPADTLPDLTPRLRQMVAELVQAEYDLPLADDCDGWLDGMGRQGMKIEVSAPRFESESEAIVYLGVSMGGLWGSGARCSWRRDDVAEAWTRGGCTGGWISDRASDPIDRGPLGAVASRRPMREWVNRPETGDTESW